MSASPMPFWHSSTHGKTASCCPTVTSPLSSIYVGSATSTPPVSGETRASMSRAFNTRSTPVSSGMRSICMDPAKKLTRSIGPSAERPFHSTWMSLKTRITLPDSDERRSVQRTTTGNESMVPRSLCSSFDQRTGNSCSSICGLKRFRTIRWRCPRDR